MCEHGLEHGCAYCAGTAWSDDKGAPMVEPDYKWLARQHETVSKRNRKGATTSEVKRYGAAYVVGAFDRSHDGLPILATPDMPDLANAAAIVGLRDVESGHLARRQRGFDAGAILALTEQLYGDEIEPLLGEDSRRTRAYQQQIRADRSDYCPVAVRTASLADGAVPETTPDVLAALSHVYARDTGTRIAWPTRRKLKSVRLRKSEADLPTETQLVAPADSPDAMFIGHRLVKRGARAERVSKRDAVSKARTDARTVGTVKAPSTVAGMAELLANLNRGERVQIAYPDGLVQSVTRSPGGIYSSPNLGQSRRAATMAQRLAQ